MDQANPFLSELVVTGPDAFNYLQSQITADLRELNNNQALPAALCDQKGRVQALVIVYKHPIDQSYRLIGPSTESAFLLARLKKYALFSKLQFLNSDNTVQTVFQDADTPSAIQNTVFQITYSDIQKEGLKISYPSQDDQTRYLVILPAQSCPALRSNKNVILENKDQWEKHNILAKWPTLNEKTRGLVTPHMLGLEKIGGVSFSKGCYLGQEIVARTQHLGKVKRHLVILKKNNAAINRPGDHDNRLGLIINSWDTLILTILEDQAVTQLSEDPDITILK